MLAAALSPLLPGPRLHAQVALLPDSTSATEWAWPQPAVATALWYLRLLPHDLSLRNDYVDRDPFRSPLVNGVMAEATTAPETMQQYSLRLFDVPVSDAADGRTAALRRCRDFLIEIAEGKATISADTLSVPLSRSLSRTVGQLPDVWQSFIRTALSALADTAWTDSLLAGTGAGERALLADSCRELVRKDEANNDRAEEVLDSLQKSNDSLAAHVRAAAAKVKWLWVQRRGSRRLAQLIDAVPALPPTGGTGLFADTVVPLATPLGLVLLGSRHADLFTADPVLIIDPGGDDEYRLTPRPSGRPRLIVDWGGDDTYLSPAGRDLGCGYFSWGLLIDRDGNDTYRAGSFSLGAGWFGVGALIDLSGRDLYEADTYTQGAGGFGLGLLYDDGPESDQYVGRLYAQGFGFAAGWGILADAGGNDVYSAGGAYVAVLNYRDHYLSMSQGFGYGTRPHFSGGVGLLLDRRGNDTYIADIFAQGCSYWWAFGGLYDGAGNDRYIAYQYAQGAATHMSAGCLFDAGGNDLYSSKGVSQGCGHDWSVGLLIDATGNDRYEATDLSQAAGSANGVGVLIDQAGDDVYNVLSRANTQGYGNPRREYGSIGLFLDLGGKDRYDGPGADGTVWLSPSTWGVGVDADSTWVGLRALRRANARH